MTESPRPIIGEDYPDAKRCRAAIRLSWTSGWSGPSRRERVRCKRRLAHAGRTHVAYLSRWNVPWAAGPERVVVRWVA